MRVLWPHNFDPQRPYAGVFMHTSAQALNEAGIKPHLCYLGNLRSPIQLLKARSLIAQVMHDYDVVHCQWGSAAALACARSTAFPKTVSLRGSDWTPAFSQRVASRMHGKLARYFTMFSLPFFDAIICMSARMAEEVARMFPRHSIHVVPDPVDLDVFRPIEKHLARRQFGLPDSGDQYVLFGSYYSTNQLKRRWLAEAAVAIAKLRHPKVRLLPVHGVPHHLMPAVISAADVAVCTSVAEGWPNIIKEALACNVPFVATDVSDLRHIANNDPHCRVAQPNPEALGHALSEVLSMPPAQSLRRHVAGMSMQAHAKHLLAIYGSLR